MADGTAEAGTNGRVCRLEPGDTLDPTGGVRHRRRANGPGTRVLLVSGSDHGPGS
ncbi:hypothetical protein [Streptomyces sp. SM11]|uniref:hypothetical protein n=1 Tax=Streptomyces sp. SM11 TaxID=565557 RepID=UPI0021561FDD|nr:hypothetical protein [Streptomyces sp. SM11]